MNYISTGETVVLSRSTYDTLYLSHIKLMSLEMGGVDNWSYYWESLDTYRKFCRKYKLDGFDDED